MKKREILIIAALAAALAVSVCGCSGKGSKNGSSSQSETSSYDRSDTSAGSQDEEPVQKPSAVSRPEAPPEPQDSDKSPEPSDSSAESSADASEASHQTAPAELPPGLTRVSKGKLQFTSSVLSLNAVFPDQFCVIDTDYIPQYGIYLQNADGTATLLAESIEDTTLTYRQMSEYLKNRYPEAKVYTSDRKDVICKMTTTDQSGNEIFVFQRIKVKNGGYNELTLCCRPEERSKYERVFNETSLT